MPIQQIQINGTNILVSELARTPKRIGVGFESDNGVVRFALKRVRRQWTLTCKSVVWATAQLIDGVYATAATLTLRDEYGTTATAFFGPEDTCTVTTALLPSDNQSVYYDVVFSLTEVLS